MPSPRQRISSINSLIYNPLLVCCIPTWMSSANAHLSHLLGVPADTVLLELTKHLPDKRILVLSSCQVEGSWRLKTGKLLLSTCSNGKFGSCHCWWREQGKKKNKMSGAKSCLGLDGNQWVQGKTCNSPSLRYSSTGKAREIPLFYLIWSKTCR